MAVYGDTAGNLIDDKARNQHLVLDDSVGGTAYGDADQMFGSSRGGNDHLTGGAGTANHLYGDSDQMHDQSRGGNDLLIGGRDSLNILVGDSDQLLSGRGGNDALFGAAGALNNLFGDATGMSNAAGGNDLLIGAANSDNNLLVGDASRMFVDAIGGNDVLRGGDNTNNQLFGDAMTIGDSGQFFRGVNVGGNDLVIAGNGVDTVNFLYGDAQFLYGQAQAGSDVLVGGTGTDFMYGDALQKTALVTTAADTFVFAPNGGNDMIDDFRSSDGDRIDVRAWGFHSVADMTITAVETGTHIAFDQSDGVTLSGIFDPATLHQTDFLFA